MKRSDKKEWDRKKLNHANQNNTDLWKSVKSWLGWGGGGPPTQLFSEGQLSSSPADLTSIMN